MKTRLNTKSIQELIELLEEFRDEYGPEAPAVFCCDYGDYCHTQQLLQIREVDAVEARMIGESGYSHSGLAITKEDDDDADDADAKVWASDAEHDYLIVLQ